MLKPLVPALTAAVLFSGCTMAPRYERPASPVATTYPTDSAATSSPAAAATADLGWREFFTDPRLQKLIELSLANNRDLRVATLRVEQARAQYRIQRAALLPTVNATGNGSRAKTPGDLNTTGQPIISEQFSVGLGFTAYELDLFGRVQSLKDRTLGTYLASNEAARSTHLALVAQVATQYLTVRQLEEQAAIARQTLEAVQSSYDVRKRSFEVGTLGELDLRTSEIQVQTARSGLASYTRLRAQAENTLAVLVGQPLPADLPAGRALREQGLLAELPAGVPSDLLQRRPDILAAEHTLKAANANIGAARAAFFPRIALTGSFGTSSADLDGLFKAGSEAWSFAPSISVPIFAAGANRANLDVANVSKQIEVANYEKAIQTAFREVADGLIARSTFREQLDAQAALLAAQQRRFELSDLRYQNGVDNYLVVLLAQQDLYTAQQALVQSRAAELINLVTLYKALGGGWNETRPANAP
ncbi:efflux transporter outer membrane subunit [Oleiharenicola lentus]|uniref:efflux transporter outer membrane subunit n=1 Tax=Oleiharenicola lentus TaxID=2508720 RepID=UPI003F66CE1A